MADVRFHDTPTGPVLENGSLRLTVGLDEGEFSLGRVGIGDEIITGASTGAELANGASLTSRGAGFNVAEVQPVEDAHGRGPAGALRRPPAQRCRRTPPSPPPSRPPPTPRAAPCGCRRPTSCEPVSPPLHQPHPTQAGGSTGTAGSPRAPPSGPPPPLPSSALHH